MKYKYMELCCLIASAMLRPCLSTALSSYVPSSSIVRSIPCSAFLLQTLKMRVTVSKLNCMFKHFAQGYDYDYDQPMFVLM
jgi:hypothetical protein